MYQKVVITLLLLPLQLTAIVSGTVAPGDESAVCDRLRSLGVIPIPNYSADMRVLMDTRNYRNLIPDCPEAVWQIPVDNDDNNLISVTTNVSSHSAALLSTS